VIKMFLPIQLSPLLLSIAVGSLFTVIGYCRYCAGLWFFIVNNLAPIGLAMVFNSRAIQ
jgi:hypothetical protein